MTNDSGLSVLMAIAKEVIRSLKIASVDLEIFDVKNVFDELMTLCHTKVGD